MPRTRRHCPGGLIYHVLNRAVARVRLFRRDGDYLAFERTLAEAHERIRVGVLGYCVMPNHWHLVLRPPGDGDLSAFMQWLTLTHAQRWRTSHGTVGYGPLYQGRFKAFVTQDDHHLLTVLRYVERNPLRAGLVQRAEDWRWSSLGRRMGTDSERARARDKNGDEDEQGGGDSRVPLAEWPVARPKNWITLVNTPQTPAEEKALRESVNRSRPFGTQAWQERTAKRLGLSSCFRPPGRPKKPEEPAP